MVDDCFLIWLGCLGVFVLEAVWIFVCKLVVFVCWWWLFEWV